MSQFHLFSQILRKYSQARCCILSGRRQFLLPCFLQTQQSAREGGRPSRALLGVNCVWFTGCGSECAEGCLREQTTQHKCGTKRSASLLCLGLESGLPRAAPGSTPLSWWHNSDGCGGHSQKKVGEKRHTSESDFSLQSRLVSRGNWKASEGPQRQRQVVQVLERMKAIWSSHRRTGQVCFLFYELPANILCSFISWIISLVYWFIEHLNSCILIPFPRETSVPSLGLLPCLWGAIVQKVLLLWPFFPFAVCSTSEGDFRWGTTGIYVCFSEQYLCGRGAWQSSSYLQSSERWYSPIDCSVQLPEELAEADGSSSPPCKELSQPLELSTMERDGQ